MLRPAVRLDRVAKLNRLIKVSKFSFIPLGLYFTVKHTRELHEHAQHNKLHSSHRDNKPNRPRAFILSFKCGKAKQSL